MVECNKKRDADRFAWWGECAAAAGHLVTVELIKCQLINCTWMGR